MQAAIKFFLARICPAQHGNQSVNIMSSINLTLSIILIFGG